MAKCDLCGKFCEGRELEELVSRYKIDNVSDVCKECKEFCNETKDKIVANIEVQMRAAISTRLYEKCGDVNKPWWRKIFA
jgi:hypothetical protein